MTDAFEHPAVGSLQGMVVGLLESRRIRELESLVRRHGGQTVSAPALSEVPLVGSPECEEAIARLASGAFDSVVFLTGIGADRLFAEAERLGRADDVRVALHQATTVCRGPKPTLVLKKRGLTPTHLVPSPNTTEQLLHTLGALDLRGRSVLVTSAGERFTEPAAFITAAGGRVTELQLYRWECAPENAQTLRDLIRLLLDGGLHALLFTAQVQVRYLFDVAATIGRVDALRDALNDGLLVGAIGPTCANALRAERIEPDAIPAHPMMGHLVLALGRAAESRRQAFSAPLFTSSRAVHS